MCLGVFHYPAEGVFFNRQLYLHESKHFMSHLSGYDYLQGYINVTVFWNVVPRNRVDMHQLCGIFFCLQL